jgi:PPE-repeat protein
MYDPLGAYFDQGFQSFLAPFNNYNMQVAYGQALSKAASAAGGVGPGIPVVGSAGGAVSAGMGRAGVVGSLSVPQGWASAAPAIRPVAGRRGRHHRHHHHRDPRGLTAAELGGDVGEFFSGVVGQFVFEPPEHAMATAEMRAIMNRRATGWVMPTWSA